MAPCRKKARITRRVSTRNIPSSTQEVLIDTDSESEDDNASTMTVANATTANENTPPPLTQNTASAVEHLFLIKQEEKYEHTHNSATRFGNQVYDDGMVVYGTPQEQCKAADSAIEQEQQITRKYKVVANPYAKKIPADPPASQPSPHPPRATNATTATPSPLTNIAATTAIVATTASFPSSADDSDDDSDDEIAKTISSNLIEDDCMLFSEEERKTLGTNRGKNTGAYEQRKLASANLG